jgi:hypothetical protein
MPLRQLSPLNSIYFIDDAIEYYYAIDMAT